MKACSSQQMRQSDEISINDYLIPGIVLMENAALGIVREIEKEIERGLLPKESSVLIICGTGNNGGDGYAVARHLTSLGLRVKVLICGDYNKIKGDALINLRVIEKIGIPIIKSFDDSKNIILEKKIDLIIDGILGTGFKGELRPDVKAIIDTINKSQAYVISIDIPTGLNSDTGFVDSICVKANKTITLGLPKIGQLINDGPFHCGELVVEGLTIPDKVYDKVGIKRYLTDRSFLKKCFKPRLDNTHKGTYGKVLAIAGSRGMAGAGLLSAGASLKAGAGIVKLAVPENLLSIVSGKIPELITKGLIEDERGQVSIESLGELIKECKDASSVIIGPGLGISDDIYEIISYLIKESEIPLVIDADGLNNLTKKPSILLERKSDIVLTPHPGEMARLLGIKANEVQNNRIEIAENFSRNFQVIVLLKGHRSVIATPWGETWINPTGNPGMATAGSGDVLAGIIAALSAQGYENHHAAICGAYIHGASGDYAVEKLGQLGMTATDIIKFIPYIFKNVV